jgi:hypothetical protein
MPGDKIKSRRNVTGFEASQEKDERDLFLAGRFGRLPVSISRKKHRPE